MRFQTANNFQLFLNILYPARRGCIHVQEVFAGFCYRFKCYYCSTRITNNVEMGIQKETGPGKNGAQICAIRVVPFAECKAAKM